MTAPPVVAWLDIGSRVGLCPSCIHPAQARNPGASDLIPVTAEEADGKGCAECGEPLAAARGSAAELMLRSPW